MLPQILVFHLSKCNYMYSVVSFYFLHFLAYTTFTLLYGHNSGASLFLQNKDDPIRPLQKYCRRGFDLSIYAREGAEKDNQPKSCKPPLLFWLTCSLTLNILLFDTDARASASAVRRYDRTFIFTHYQQNQFTTLRCLNGRQKS